MPSGFSEMKNNSEEDQESGYHHQVTLASFPDSHDILNADIEVVQAWGAW